MQHRLILAFGILVGCGGDVSGGRTYVCLDGPMLWGGDEGEELRHFPIEGSFVEIQSAPTGDFALQTCWAEVDQALVIADSNGETWRIGFNVQDAEGQSVVPVIDLEPGEDVDVLVRLVQSFGEAAGFIVSDGEGLLMAVEQGTWGAALEEGDVPISVLRGERVAVADDDCGRTGKWEIVFGGDSEVAVSPYGVGAVSIEGSAYTAVAAQNSDFVGQPSCTDVGGVMSWALFRDPS